MKVVTQLIHHFWDRGALSVDQAGYLVRQGFVRPEELKGFMGQSTDADSDDLAHEFGEQFEDVAEELTRRTAAPRGRKGRPKGPVVSLDGLGVLLQEEFGRRAGVFPALVQLAGSFGPCARWEEGVVALRNVPGDRFNQGLGDLLRTRPALLGALWQAVDPEPFHALAGDRALRGAAVRGFQALLQSADASQLGKYAWVLRGPEVAIVSNLLRIHRRLLTGLNALYVHQDGGLSNALQHDLPDVLYWAFVYGYNARRGSTSGDGFASSRESGPLGRPEDATRRLALTCALMMNPSGLLRLLEIEDQQRPLVRPWSWRMDPCP